MVFVRDGPSPAFLLQPDGEAQPVIRVLTKFFLGSAAQQRERESNMPARNALGPLKASARGVAYLPALTEDVRLG
jgi:hypothetical protein